MTYANFSFPALPSSHQTRGVLFSTVVDAQQQFFHIPLADHLALLQSILLPLAVQYGADCPRGPEVSALWSSWTPSLV